eukprot:CAMPEP_0176063844 /NCGR_PEP_ID=MMETSP0120_2-20121206/31843_1 /TAXON_ID=160619 /ORGANISM="Kryptoperidinium foliaceum, Strain CCMP 1326" /LENGTH=162 /DNA_ID=CAMNT_0017397419 /DNA_START=184 /DNA_END=673 /DNA_ORIENTATION=-
MALVGAAPVFLRDWLGQQAVLVGLVQIVDMTFDKGERWQEPEHLVRRVRVQAMQGEVRAHEILQRGLREFEAVQSRDAQRSCGGPVVVTTAVAGDSKARRRGAGRRNAVAGDSRARRRAKLRRLGDGGDGVQHPVREKRWSGTQEPPHAARQAILAESVSEG